MGDAEQPDEIWGRVGSLRAEEFPTHMSVSPYADNVGICDCQYGWCGEWKGKARRMKMLSIEASRNMAKEVCSGYHGISESLQVKEQFATK